MSSKYLIISGLCLILGLFGIENTIYWCLFFSAFILGFIIHLIIHKKLWLKSNPIYDKIKTSFIKSKLVTHVRYYYLQMFLFSEGFNGLFIQEN